jgi:hypothetical protein
MRLRTTTPYWCALLLILIGIQSAWAQNPRSIKFEQLDYLLPTPNNYRAASGAPGHEYWQQRADYKIEVTLDDDKQMLKAKEVITYYNQSPDPLDYLWLQLDQNRFAKNSIAFNTTAFDLNSPFSLVGWMRGQESKHGFRILAVKDAQGNALPFTINETMMRVDLPQTLAPRNGKVVFSVEWEHYIIDANKMGGRGGYEYFEKDGNYLYEISQWFPRMAVYDDVNGWQHKQFLGRGEFALTFGDYEVHITAPEDHIVASTGELQNPEQVLSNTQRQRLEQAKNAQNPVLIVTQAEAEKAEKSKAKKTKTWIYKAENVRDFAWASSRKFIWDAMQVEVEGKKIWAMSYFPKEGNPLWGDYSTHVVAHTLREYSKMTFAYPYPVAISVHGPVFGMEYPMICFNGGRPEPDGTVPDRTRNAMVSVIIHEVGHNYFPMIVNSDERQWSWMDEGLNSFLQYVAEQEIPNQPWAQKDYPKGSKYPSRRGPAKNIVDYMRADPAVLEPIMTNSEQIMQFGNNAYGKPATALNILRETVMGRDLFDHAFKVYSNRWMFKHPMPADFFRTMEDASAVDLDWFWRGWFFGTEPCDISLDEVEQYFISSQKPENANGFTAQTIDPARLDEVFARMEVSAQERRTIGEGKYLYLLRLSNPGGLIMPLIVGVEYQDGTQDLHRFAAEIWRMNPEKISRLIVTDKPVKSFLVDPLEETADINIDNNIFPRQGASPSRFEQFKNRQN